MREEELGSASRMLVLSRAHVLGDVASALREHVARFGEEALSREAQEEKARDAALVSDSALVTYEGAWRRRLTRLQQTSPARWRVHGWSDEEVRDELLLRLLAALRGDDGDARNADLRPGREWALTLLSRERRALSRSFRLRVIPTDTFTSVDRAALSDEVLMAEESQALLRRATECAEAALSAPQRRWLSAMKMSANAGAFFESSGRLNLSAASRMLEKNRSSATRAFEELSRHFARELRKASK